MESSSDAFCGCILSDSVQKTLGIRVFSTLGSLGSGCAFRLKGGSRHANVRTYLKKETSMSLEIHVHLEDGRVSKFGSVDEAEIAKILSNLNPTKLYSPQLMMLGNDTSLSAFRSARVIRIDFISESLPVFQFLHNVNDIQEVTPEEHDEWSQIDSDDLQRDMGDRVNRVHSEIEMTNGSRIFLQVDVVPRSEGRTPIDTAMFIQQLFGSEGVYFRRRGGGIIVLNPSHIVRISFNPSPPIAPPGLWRMIPIQ